MYWERWPAKGTSGSRSTLDCGRPMFKVTLRSRVPADSCSWLICCAWVMICANCCVLSAGSDHVRMSILEWGHSLLGIHFSVYCVTIPKDPGKPPRTPKNSSLSYRKLWILIVFMVFSHYVIQIIIYSNSFYDLGTRRYYVIQILQILIVFMILSQEDIMSYR